MISFSEEFKRRLVDGLTEGHVVVASYVDRKGEPHASFYGSVHAHSDNQIGLWARNPESELVQILDQSPVVAFVYADLSTRTFYRFRGHARLVTDDATRDQVFEGMHPFEQGQDAERKGSAIVVDVDYYAGREESGVFEQTAS